MRKNYIFIGIGNETFFITKKRYAVNLNTGINLQTAKKTNQTIVRWAFDCFKGVDYVCADYSDMINRFNLKPMQGEHPAPAPAPEQEQEQGEHPAPAPAPEQEQEQGEHPAPAPAPEQEQEQGEHPAPAPAPEQEQEQGEHPAPAPAPEQEQEQGEQEQGLDPVTARTLAYLRDFHENEIPRGVYLWGKAGTGKSFSVKVCAEKMGLELYPLSNIKNIYDIAGYMSAMGEFVESNFYKWAKHGGILLLDEMDTYDSDMLLALNGAISDRRYMFPNGELVHFHKDCLFCGTGNTKAGGITADGYFRKPFDTSVKNRFKRLEVGYNTILENRLYPEIAPCVHELREMLNTAEYAGSIITLRNMEQYTSTKRVETKINAGVCNSAVIKMCISDLISECNENKQDKIQILAEQIFRKHNLL